MPKTHKAKKKERLSGVKKGKARKELLKLQKQIERKISALETVDDIGASLGRNPRTSRVELDDKVAAAALFALQGTTPYYDQTLNRVHDQLKKEFKKKLKDKEFKDLKAKKNALLKKLKQTYQ